MFKQKTAYDMRISDWSSDVFSSVLVARPRNRRVQAAHIAGPPPRRQRAPPASALCPRRTHGGISGCVIASSIVARTKGSRARISPLDDRHDDRLPEASRRSEEHTSELQSLTRISYAVFCLKKKNKQNKNTRNLHTTRQQ